MATRQNGSGHLILSVFLITWLEEGVFAGEPVKRYNCLCFLEDLLPHKIKVNQPVVYSVSVKAVHKMLQIVWKKMPNITKKVD